MKLNYKGVDFSIEDKLAAKLDKVIDRVVKKHPRYDAVFENSGYEGSGKTNGSIVEVAYIKTKLDRPVSLFLKTSSAVAFAANTREQIIIIDEPSFESLASDHATNLSKDLLRLTSTMREKRHIVIINFAKFWKFPDFLTVDRSLFMVHFKSKKGKDIGRFLYIKGDKLGTLWEDYQKYKKKNYGKLKSFGGWFPYKMEELWNVLDMRVEEKEHCDFKAYQLERDRAVASIGVKPSNNKKELKLIEENKMLKYAYATLPNVTYAEKAKHINKHRITIIDWSHLGENDEIHKENEDFDIEKEDSEGSSRTDRVSLMGDQGSPHAHTIEDEPKEPVYFINPLIKKQLVAYTDPTETEKPTT